MSIFCSRSSISRKDSKKKLMQFSKNINKNWTLCRSRLTIGLKTQRAKKFGKTSKSTQFTMICVIFTNDVCLQSQSLKTKLSW
jgi:hypothetical protein